MVTPKQLAPALGIPAKKLRRWLRRKYRLGGINYWQRWHLSPDQIVAACRRFS